MAEWRVQLQGDQFDLQEIKEILLGHDPCIIEEGSNFYLTSKVWINFKSQGKSTVKPKTSSNCWQRSLVFFHHLITLSALYSIDCGIVRPICFAVFRLITSSNFFGCSTGRSAGLVPFRILST
jgi:hypothetical protein